MTSLFDLKWPFRGSHIQFCTDVINSSLIEHGSEQLKQTWSVFEAFEFFPIDLKWGGHEIDLTLGHR